MSAPNSAAAPFYFSLFRKNGKYAVVGEGTGSKSITDKTYEELLRLTDADIRELLDSAKRLAKR